MPKITEETVTRKSEDGGPCGPVEMLRFSDTGDLTQFGAYVEILPPGSMSALKHWHAEEDEMVYVLTGEITLVEGDTRTEMRSGDAATFKAGDPVGHHLINEGSEPVKYLVIGSRFTDDTVTYPDNDRVLIRSDGPSQWTDLDGRPASNAYE